MSAYSLDLREKIIAAIKEGEGKTAVARRFKVDVSTVKRYVKRAEAGCLKAKAASGPPSWLTPEAAKELKQQVEDHNDWTLEQHAEALGKATELKVKKSAIAKYFKKLNITRKKKSLIPTEQDEEKRQEYQEEVSKRDAKTFVFIDEASSYVGISFNYGRGPKGKRVFDTRPKGRDKKKRVSLLSAIDLNKHNCMAAQSLVVEGSVDKTTFLGYLEFILLPTLEEGSVLVMDNWTVHHGEEVRGLVQDFGCELLYLPTYSPDLNPIEHLFAKVKAVIKKAKPETIQQLIQSFCDAVNSVTYQHILNSVRHCGYHINVGQ